jgi:hypothetical protein
VSDEVLIGSSLQLALHEASSRLKVRSLAKYDYQDKLSESRTYYRTRKKFAEWVTGNLTQGVCLDLRGGA